MSPGDLSFRVGGLEVIVSSSIPGEWRFPTERFWTYEPSDEWWCQKYGIGMMVHETVYQVGNKLVMHPSMYKLVKKATKEKT